MKKKQGQDITPSGRVLPLQGESDQRGPLCLIYRFCVNCSKAGCSLIPDTAIGAIWPTAWTNPPSNTMQGNGFSLKGCRGLEIACLLYLLPSITGFGFCDALLQPLRGADILHVDSGDKERTATETVWYHR